MWDYSDGIKAQTEERPNGALVAGQTSFRVFQVHRVYHKKFGSPICPLQQAYTDFLEDFFKFNHPQLLPN